MLKGSNCGLAALSLGIITITAGCSRDSSDAAVVIKSNPVSQSSYALSGKVTYNGEPLRYGYVLLYSFSAVDSRNGKMTPPRPSPIDSDGGYKLEHPPVGPCVLCIASDPDLDVNTLIRGPADEVQPGKGNVGQPTKGGQAPSKGGPVGAPRPPMPGMPPLGPTMPINPIVGKMSDEQKAVLREVHQKFNNWKSSPNHLVISGQVDQVHDLKLSPTTGQGTSGSKPGPK